MPEMNLVQSINNALDLEMQRDADDLVPRNNRPCRRCQFTIDDMQIGAAHAAGTNLEKNLIRVRLGRRQVARA